MKKLKLLALTFFAVGCLFLSGCKDTDSNAGSQKSTENKNVEVQTDAPKEGDTIAVFHIKDYGDITVRLFENAAPKAVENFVTHSKEGYYDGVIFHRVIQDFMIQGGDPQGTGTGGESIWGTEFEDEIVESLVPIRGALCMANRGANTNGSQFFIVQAKDSNLDTVKEGFLTVEQEEMFEQYGGTPHLVGGYTVFGQVVEGMDVVDKIAEVKTDAKDKPNEDVIIEKIEIKEYKN